MTQLIPQIAKIIRERVTARVRALHGGKTEWRSVFHGPPMEFLKPVFEELSKGGGIQVELPEGTTRVPVLLRVETISGANPAVNDSGVCTGDHLLNLRNSPNCPRFIALISPGEHTNLSFASASDEFGLTAANNTGNATIEDWWRDDFIQLLVEGAIARMALSTEAQKEQVRQMVQLAVIAAEEAERHGVQRLGAWQVLARIYCIPGSVKAGPLLSLACGFPPCEDGQISAKDQAEILDQLADHLEANGISKGLEELKERDDADPQDVEALTAFGEHLHSVLDIPTPFVRAACYYYGPNRLAALEEPPSWWSHLTVEKWTELLEEERRPEGALRLECENAVFPPFKGGHAVVQGEVKLVVSAPEDEADPVDAQLTRLVSGKAHTLSWNLSIQGSHHHHEAALPPHKAWARYVVEANGLKKAAIRVISLATWEPGFFIFCRNAKKIEAPKEATKKNADSDFECSLSLLGNGRHYMDIYTRAGVEFAQDATGYEDDGITTEAKKTTVTKVDDYSWGFEAEAQGECHYDLSVRKDGGEWEKVRVFITCEDVAAEGCKTEFERLIKLNRQTEVGRATTDVQLDRNVRCADLQTWLLAKENVEKSFYPLVVSTDYAASWRPPDWASAAKSVLSNGQFLHDPRPLPEQFSPPEEFVEARKWLAAKVRGSDDNGLVEAARLGEWLASDDQEFAEKIHTYLQAYLNWVEAEPTVAPWVDLIAFCGLETDNKTLRQEPDAICLNPLHPVRLAWQALAQKTLFLSWKRNHPCPAASVLDPDMVPDILNLPLFTASGAVGSQPFLSVECSSDYWGILWNGRRIEALPDLVDNPPFNEEFGLRIGGISSGFSLAQVRRALDDVAGMLAAKPVMTVMISSASGQTNACNEGIADWCKERLGETDDAIVAMGQRMLQILDLRQESSRPEDADISNLAEDTSNAVKWFAGDQEHCVPDLGIIAQLETSNAKEQRVEVGSPLAWGALVRHRVRQQFSAGKGAFLCESRMGMVRPPVGDSLADKLVSTLVRLENMSENRRGYEFAPSVHAIQHVLNRADFAAVSSAAVDPACFLGSWLPGYLWDYDLPSYSQRSGDTNGYYLISKIKQTDQEALKSTLAKLPNCDNLSTEQLDSIILEVARRGIPTVRGLSSGNHGASGDLGLFVASRLLQDAFRLNGDSSSLLPVLEDNNGVKTIALIIPVDPFRGYLDDLQRAVKHPTLLRPDLLVVGIRLSDSGCAIKLTPIEVKYRTEVFPLASCKEALAQAAALSALLSRLLKISEEADLVLWKLAFSHFIASMLGFAFRVYSQQRLLSHQSKQWTEIHAAVISALFSDEAKLEIDNIGRLIVVDKSSMSAPRDIDEDSFHETLVISPQDASRIVTEEKPSIYDLIKQRVLDWRLLPSLGHSPEPQKVKPVEPPPFAKPLPAALPVPDEDKKGDATLPVEPSTVAGPVAAESDKTPGDVGKKDQEPESTIPEGEGIKFPVGETIDGFKKELLYFNPSDTNLNQLNIGVVGDLGTGKTQLLKGLIYRISKSASLNRGITPRFLIFDYKKDYSDPEFVKAVGAKVVKPHRLPINIFDIKNSKDSLTPWLDRFNFFSDVLDKIYSGIGPVQRKQLKSAVRQAYEACGPDRQPTVYDVNSCYAAIIGNKADSPSAILEDLVDREVFHPEPEKAESFENFLKGVVVVDLASLGQDDRAKDMVVAAMLNMFYEHMLTIPKRPYIGTDPQLRAVDSFLLVDEADNIMRHEFDVLRKVLLQGREFGVGVILASQYLRHFKAGASDYREPLLTWFLHKVPNVTANELQSLGMSSDVAQLAERIKALPKHCCLYKSFGVPGEVIEGIPFYKLLTSGD